MTDYELVSLLTESIMLLWQIFATYVSIVFAFLVATYLVSHKLAAKMVSTVIALYTLVVAWSLFGISRTSATVIALANEIKLSVLQGNASLAWHPVVSTPDLALTFIQFLNNGVAVFAYVASIIFFFHQRSASGDG